MRRGLGHNYRHGNGHTHKVGDRQCERPVQLDGQFGCGVAVDVCINVGIASELLVPHAIGSRRGAAPH